MESKITRSQANAALKGLASANNKALKWRSIVMQYSMERFGCEPGDVDNDQFIDAVDGGCGYCEGMTIDEFDESMEEATNRR